MPNNEFCLEVWGPYACYTNPVCKTERFTYPIPTPSVIRGIFSAIYVKPTKCSWEPTKVQVLKPIRYINVKRNEVNSKMSYNPINTEDDRTQRQTVALYDVKYRIWAKLVTRNGEQIGPLIDQFKTRAFKGSFFAHPCFGLKEFFAFYKFIEDGSEAPVENPLNMHVGLMLYDVFDYRVTTKQGRIAPSVFDANVLNSICVIPPYTSSQVRKQQECA